MPINVPILYQEEEDENLIIEVTRTEHRLSEKVPTEEPAEDTEEDRLHTSVKGVDIEEEEAIGKEEFKSLLQVCDLLSF